MIGHEDVKSFVTCYIIGITSPITQIMWNKRRSTGGMDGREAVDSHSFQDGYADFEVANSHWTQ